MLSKYLQTIPNQYPISLLVHTIGMHSYQNKYPIGMYSYQNKYTIGMQHRCLKNNSLYNTNRLYYEDILDEVHFLTIICLPHLDT